MSEVFHDYARYYDLLYKDKDYEAEAAYINSLIQKNKPGAVKVLNLGCGTGKHDACLVKFGYSITGVDLSETMLGEARKRAIPGKLAFVHGDIRTVKLDEKFDVVISLFHVMSYQTTDVDILSAFKTASDHLKDGGVLIFDFWHGEGVLKDPPVLRVKRLEDDAVRVVRIAEPILHADRHVIDVNYQIITMDKRSGGYSELCETHAMRYFFLPEIERFMAAAGLSLCSSAEWMADRPLACAWYGVVAAGKQEF